MKKIACSFVVLFGFLTMQKAVAQQAFCSLKGSVLVVKDARLAQIKVFQTDSEPMADFLVFKADNKLFADKPGLWHFTEVRAQADFTIAFVTEEIADVKVFFIENESFAGCR
jgi:hypothetical protein